MTKVSIIVPVYNVERYVDRCLNSLVKQTLKDIEIIIVNDGSTDNSKKEMEKYLEVNNIKYFEKTNGGLSSARNFGMKYATGEYIAFLDSDDYVEKNMYEEMYNLAKQEDADMVECDFVWEWEDTGEIKKDKRRNYKNRKEMIRRPRVVAWNKLIKTEIIKQSGIKFPDGLIYEDLEFYYKIIPYINRISYVNKYFVHYIQRNNSISNSQTTKNADIFVILDNIFKFYKEKGLCKKYKKELKYMKKRILFGSSMKRILKIKDRKLRRNLILQTIRFSRTEKNGEQYTSKNDYTKRSNQRCSRICFGITKLGIGGAERVLVDMANALEKQNYDITIFTLYGGGELEKELDQNIRLISIYKNEKKNKIIPIYMFLFGKHIYNRFLKGKYDIEIAFLEGPITRIFSYSKNQKIAWVHNDINEVYGKSIKAKLKKKIDKHFYKKYDEIVFVSKQNKKAFENLYGNISKRVVRYNYIDKDRVIKMAQEEIAEKLEHPNFLTVSRLVKQKGIDRFIRVHKRLLDRGIIHKVYVIGDGEEKQNLQKLIKKLGVEDSFVLLGKKDNPYPYIKCCDYVALLSYFEGYGMVLEEAKILNKPIIVTDTAAVEAIKEYSNSLIIQNDEDKMFVEICQKVFGKEV